MSVWTSTGAAGMFAFSTTLFEETPTGYVVEGSWFGEVHEENSLSR
jgi:hypothetical protein